MALPLERWERRPSTSLLLRTSGPAVSGSGVRLRCYIMTWHTKQYLLGGVSLVIVLYAVFSLISLVGWWLGFWR